LGVVLYEMLTGELPYDADTPLGIAMKHVNGRLTSPKEIDPHVPAGINAITVRLLAKDPADRYASDAELIEDLERVTAGLEPTNATTEVMSRLMPTTSPTRVGPPPPPRARRNGKRRRSTPLILALLALLLLAPLALAGYNLLQPQQAEEVPQIAVPNLVGMTQQEAEDRVGNDFDIRVEDRVENEKKVDTILSQSPNGGEAEKGSTISVVVVGTQVADVPNVVGQGRDAAQQTLEEAGFGVTSQERESTFEQEGRVIGQAPQGGTQEEVGSTVTITVGSGPSTVQVPDLYGVTPDQAAGILEESDLVLGGQTESPSDEVAEGQIIEQQPAAGAAVEPGSEVSVTVSSGPELRTVPNVVGQSPEQAQAELWNAYFASTVVTVQSDEPEGTVVSTDPPAGTRANWRAITVTVNVSAGPPPEPEEEAEARQQAREDAQQAREDAQQAREEGREDRGRGNGGDRGRGRRS
jgi:beta-lactam-binding protein with PASTA domain